ncbi:hypothetical protein SAMN05661010_02554 [Modicisalibacter muralis]|uniref:Uncharacterized protein n=1 Tax=Modicisalibacter muralis TaxID=119000 RepID=A0A1G9MX82_9GAMM|nr:hypothetical protein SAMN05661010_02554 [Halomonas muralis]
MRILQREVCLTSPPRACFTRALSDGQQITRCWRRVGSELLKSVLLLHLAAPGRRSRIQAAITLAAAGQAV